MKPILLRLHRWTTLIFAVPLAVLIVTGLILSVEPIVQTGAIKPGALTAGKLGELLKQHDPAGKATALSYRGYEGILSLNGVLNGEALLVDIKTGKAIDDDDDAWLLSDVFSEARGLHERLIFDNGLAVAISTYAFLALMTLGLLMGLPFLRNTIGGWHRCIAWFLLPLLILSPLTGLALVHGITFAAPNTGPRTQPLPIADAVRIAGQSHDLSGLTWIRQRGGRQLARIYDGSEARVFAVTAQGLQPTQRNWPRALHEGNWAGALSGWLNVLTSVAFFALMGTGIFIWARRHVRRIRNNSSKQPAAAPQPAE